jgi:hypothetical protein
VLGRLKFGQVLSALQAVATTDRQRSRARRVRQVCALNDSCSRSRREKSTTRDGVGVVSMHRPRSPQAPGTGIASAGSLRPGAENCSELALQCQSHPCDRQCRGACKCIACLRKQRFIQAHTRLRTAHARSPDATSPKVSAATRPQERGPGSSPSGPVRSAHDVV